VSEALPIVDVLPQVIGALETGRSLVIQAPPGAGKSTRVPLELLEQPWAQGRRILMLEPRRLAARAVAARMASLLGEPVGRTVGVRMRLDTRVSAQTRLEVLTEGVLSGMLHDDPALEDVACVIFDEFHERSLQADLGLALCLDARQHLNESLRIVVMSATLEVEPVARLLEESDSRFGQTAIVRSEGRTHPVDVRYAARVADASLEPRVIAERCANAVRRALEETTGDVLVFLPGAGEIRRVQDLLEAHEPAGVMLAPLFGDLSREEQDRAIAPAPAHSRKVVLATNIAETSLTIEGVRVVVDAGVARRARFDPVTGMSRLDTLRISRASADQRCGRAGRLAAGTCYRLWTQATQRTLEAHTPAEILEADLAPLALEMAGWNITDPRALRWLDAPPAGSLAQARDLLRQLGALDGEHRITAHGRAMLRLRTHPRMAHMLLRARDLGLSSLAAGIAAVLTERLDAGAAARDADLRKRLDILKEGGGDRGARERARRTAELFLRQLGERGSRTRSHDDDPVGTLIALAYPDRIARQKSAGRYVLSGGRGAVFTAPQSLARSEFLAIAELDAGEREALIRAAAPLSREALEDAFAGEIAMVDDIRWDARERAVLATCTRRLGELVIDSKPLRNPDARRVAAVLLQGIRETSLDVLPWTRELRVWQARVAFVRRLPSEAAAGWPDVSDEGLAARLDDWLAPWIEGMSRIDHLARLDLRAALESLLEWRLRERLDALAPLTVQVPSGSHIRIDYLDPETPSLPVRLQEVFGLRSTPRIGGGAVALVMKLLSPAQRPVQVTRDLESFWSSGYAEVRRELKGRYPKHYWPEDPLQAQPRRGTRK
jgi:ATP-dependent helicase HrpB